MKELKKQLEKAGKSLAVIPFLKALLNKLIALERRVEELEKSKS